jgi:hypothetical protein
MLLMKRKLQDISNALSTEVGRGMCTGLHELSQERVLLWWSFMLNGVEALLPETAMRSIS